MIANCGLCGKEIEKQTGHYNRAKKLGLNIYCDRKCSGLGRRKNKSIEQKKKEKSEYDKEYRRLNFDYVKERASAYFKLDYASNPEKYRLRRRGQVSNHRKHLSTPEYKKWKHHYDKKYRSEKLYGELAEAALVLIELEKELESKQIKYDYGITQNKSSQKRKRQWQRLQRHRAH